MGSEQQIDAPQVVERILDEAVQRQASDVHLEPTAGGYEVRYRIDGLLQPVGTYDAVAGRSLVNRVMVLAHLLTYRMDVPQEGRIGIALPSAPQAIDLRVAVIPTAYGIRAAIRLPAELIQPRRLESLGLPEGVWSGLMRFVRADSGMLIVSGPAGSGKTTTIYSVLEKIAEVTPGLSIITLEDPVERHLAGVTQIEVSPFGQMTYEKALRSILRQDPQVLMLGEIRDSATASLGIQAALSGHRLICTLHAASPAGAIARLFEMGIEPYQITSAVFGVLVQRLVRRRVDGGYSGRAPVAEMMIMDEAVRRAVAERQDVDALRRSYEQQPGYVTMQAVAADLVAKGITDAAETGRVLGEAGR